LKVPLIMSPSLKTLSLGSKYLLSHPRIKSFIEKNKKK
jgi:hypothetical protein